MAEARVSFHIGVRARARTRARAMARASARGRARTSLELGLGLVRVSCIIKKWFKQNSAAGVLVVVALVRQRNEHGF